MTVKCLSQEEKNIIITAYNSKCVNQKEIAQYWKVSERTINRVLIEAGVATPVARIKGEAYQVMQILKKYEIAASQLEPLIQKSQLLTTAQVVEAYLRSASEEEVGRLFWVTNKSIIKKELMREGAFIDAA